MNKHGQGDSRSASVVRMSGELSDRAAGRWYVATMDEGIIAGPFERYGDAVVAAEHRFLHSRVARFRAGFYGMTAKYRAPGRLMHTVYIGTGRELEREGWSVAS